MPKLSVWLVRASLVHMGIGFLFGALMLLQKGIPVNAHLWQLLNPHIELMIFGWTLQFVMGIAFWILPRFSGDHRYGKVYLGWWSFGFLNTGILLTGVSADTTTEFMVKIWSDTGDVSTRTVTVIGGLAPTDMFLGFNSFSLGADFTSVNAIGLFFDSTNTTLGSDMKVGSISATTPEPASIALMGLGGLLAGYGVRRRNKKSLEEMVS